MRKSLNNISVFIKWNKCEHILVLSGEPHLLNVSLSECGELSERDFGVKIIWSFNLQVRALIV